MVDLQESAPATSASPDHLLPGDSSPLIRGLYASDEFYIGCGTVTFDRATRKILVIRDHGAEAEAAEAAGGKAAVSPVYKLPRGRKDWAEDLSDTAIRETLEETGVEAATLLPVPLYTRATPPPGHPFLSQAQFDPSGNVASGVPLVEPVAAMLHYQANGALALVFWYVAEADSQRPLRTNTQMEDEDYEALWVDYEAAAGMMCNKDYARVVRVALEVVQKLD